MGNPLPGAIDPSRVDRQLLEKRQPIYTECRFEFDERIPFQFDAGDVLNVIQGPEGELYLMRNGEKIAWARCTTRKHLYGFTPTAWTSQDKPKERPEDLPAPPESASEKLGPC